MNYDNIFNLKNKTIIVTGGAGLLGKEICRGLDEYNANVIIADVDYENALKLENELSNNAKAIKTDITSKSSVKKLMNEVINKYNRIDVLINNAYPRNKNYGNKLEDVSLEDWRENIDLHLNSYFLISKKAIEIMKQQNYGNIINIGSIYGIQAPDFQIYEGLNMTSPVEYSAIKGGIINFSRYLASYLGNNNIRVNILSPGGIFDNQEEEFIKRYEKNTPLNRMGNPNDIVGGIIFLSSDASKYITGHNLVIDGGWTIK